MRHMWRTLGLTALSVTGMVVAAACLLALYLELTGFGGPPDTATRWPYRASLLLGVCLGVGIPVAAFLWSQPLRTRAVGVAVVSVAVLLVGGVLLMGLG
jgi:hypothetical protein